MPSYDTKIKFEYQRKSTMAVLTYSLGPMKLNCREAKFCCLRWGPRGSSLNTGAHCLGNWNSRKGWSSSSGGLSVNKNQPTKEWLTIPQEPEDMLNNGFVICNRTGLSRLIMASFDGLRTLKERQVTSTDHMPSKQKRQEKGYLKSFQYREWIRKFLHLYKL